MVRRTTRGRSRRRLGGLAESTQVARDALGVGDHGEQTFVTWFLVIGAYAVGIHGRPRATKDLDVGTEAGEDNAARVLRALHQFGAPLGDLVASDLERVGVSFKMGTYERGFRRAPRPDALYVVHTHFIS